MSIILTIQVVEEWVAYYVGGLERRVKDARREKEDEEKR